MKPVTLSVVAAGERVGEVLLLNGGVFFGPETDPGLRELAEGLTARPSLPLRAEKSQAVEGGLRIMLQETQVTPADEGYPQALAQLISRETGYSVEIEA
ncbi:MAG: hypothetical protein JWM80_5642 [Cyanobacteria bacterium RYN_339]|nr:hypothetical protein [Cyanobacteria bacterium RYN_339]